MLPDGLEDRFKRLRRRPTERAALRADREGAVVSVAFATDRQFFAPELPLGRPRSGRLERVERPRHDDVLAGLDAEGRPVLVRRAYGLDGEAPRAIVAHPSEDDGGWVLGVRLLTWTAGRVEIAGFLTSDSVSHVTWIDFDERGRPLGSSTAGVPYNDLGRGAERAWCDWDGDRCVRVRSVTASERGDRWTSHVRAGEYDDAGLVRVRAAGTTEPAAPGDAVAALSTLVPDRVVWDRVIDGPEPDPLAPEAATAAWVEGMATALERVAAQADDPVAVILHLAASPEDRPSVRVVERTALDGMAGRAEPREAVAAAGGPWSALTPFLDEEGGRAMRSLRHHDLVPWRDEDDAAVEALQRRLVAAPWLALAGGWELVDRVHGAERVAALIGLPPAAPTPQVERTPRDRAELVDLITAFGLPVALADQAQVGYALVAGGAGRSRLGGRPELPASMAWPVDEGRPLVHLATLDLRELPAAATGVARTTTLAFFADLTEEAELYEPVVVGDDPRVRVVAIDPDAPVVALDPPPHDRDEFDVPPAMDERRVRYVPVVTLPARPTGLTDAERLAYGTLHERLCELTPGLWRPPHLVLGHPNVMQDDPRAPGQVSLLHVGWDPDLGFEFLDAGVLTFYGDAADVAAGRWDRLTVAPASC
jgi:hypothetical protein